MNNVFTKLKKAAVNSAKVLSYAVGLGTLVGFVSAMTELNRLPVIVVEKVYQKDDDNTEHT